jgi:MFS family permease
LAGLLALAIAMGIGRFAFTPLLPLMLHDGLLDLPEASWLASANYLGYWLGAMGCALQPVLWRRWGRPALEPTAMVRFGLAATVLLTLGMALPWPAAWGLWRGLAGVASALVFVYVSGWCLARLSELGAPALAGVIFVGPGLGIAVSGFAVTAMVTLDLRAAAGWVCFALLALALTLLAWPRLQGAVKAPAGAAPDDSPPPRGVIAALTLAYGLAGFGYTSPPPSCP